MPVILFLLASAAIIGDSGTLLRSSCDNRAPVITKAPAGTPVSLRFSVAGESGSCYRVSAVVDGQEVGGYVASDELIGTESYRAEVASAPRLVSTTPVTPAGSASSGPATAPSSSNPLVEATNLMQKRQPKAALQLLESRIKSGARDYDTLVLAGVAARASDDPRTALGYLEESQKRHADPGVLKMLTDVRRELQGDRSSERLYSNRFLLRFEGGSLEPDTARGMLAVLEAEYARVSGELGCRIEERVTAIVQSPEAYRASSEAAEWSGGSFDGSRIRIPVSRAATVTPALRQTFAHELVHACLASMGNFPVWVHEGLAQRISAGEASSQTRFKVRSLLRTGSIPRLTNMAQSWTRLSPEHASQAYAHAAVAADTLYAMFPGTGIRNVLRDPSRFDQYADAIDRSLTE